MAEGEQVSNFARALPFILESNLRVETHLSALRRKEAVSLLIIFCLLFTP